MYSQHKHLAAVWEHLQGHNDISGILREVIGHHALQNVFQDDDNHLSGDSFGTIIWIKILYDLQRCYLGGTSTAASHTSSQISSWLLPIDLLFSSIIYLINVKVKIFPSQTMLMTKEFTRPRLILAQTVLSGLRLLLLQHNQISWQQKRALQAALNQAWRDDDLSGVEGSIIKQVFAAILDVMTEPHHVDAYRAEREHARLPTYASGLYPLDIRPEIAVTPLIHALAEEEDDWIDAYCVLYDALWAVESAVTQRYIDLSRQHGTADLDPSVIESDEIFEHLYHQRSSLIVSAFHVKGPMVPSDTLMESLVIHLLDWDTSLDSFLSRQDSLIQHRMFLPQVPTRIPNYGKQITRLRPYFETATTAFAVWLSNRTTSEAFLSHATPSLPSRPTRNTISAWISRMTCANSTLYSQPLEVPQASIYIVGCNKLHAVPKMYLGEQLRWIDKWAYQGIQEDTPILNWKEGVQCPSCPPGEKIKCARLLEPLHVPPTLSEGAQQDIHQDARTASQWSGESSNSHVATTASTASYSVSDGGRAGHSFPGLSITRVRIPTTVSESRSVPGRSKSAEAQPPSYTESPISPMTLPHFARSFGSNMPDYPVSPLTESLNVPIPVSSRLSMDLPIPVHTPDTSGGASMSVPSDLTNIRLNSSPAVLTWSAEVRAKSKSTGRSSRLASSMRRKPTVKDKGAVALPKEPAFAFSSSGRSLLLWSKAGEHVSRFDVSEDDVGAIPSCRYDAQGVEAVAAGHRKCAIMIAKDTSSKILKVFDGLNSTVHEEIELDVFGRTHEKSIAVSKDDKHLAVSLNDQIDLFSLENGLKRIAFHHQMDVYELRGGVSHRRSIPVTRTTSDESTTEGEKADSGSWFSSSSKALNFTEAAEEQQRETAIISRKLYFSTDNQRLVAATQLGDHCVYVDVWDVTREPVSTISEHSRSFKLPPWVLNDGDLTGVFYDSARRAALVTAFIGKEYPVLIPFPGYDPLQNETYSTKIIAAAQSPAGTTFIVANSMTEIIQFEYTAKGTLSPHKLKKSSNKISNSIFKPGAIALAMPSEDTLLAFWIKDGKCMLRTIKLGMTESIKDVDIRPHYDRLMNLKDRPVVSRATSSDIPELDAGDIIANIDVLLVSIAKLEKIADVHDHKPLSWMQDMRTLDRGLYPTAALLIEALTAFGFDQDDEKRQGCSNK